MRDSERDGTLNVRVFWSDIVGIEGQELTGQGWLNEPAHEQCGDVHAHRRDHRHRHRGEGFWVVTQSPHGDEDLLEILVRVVVDGAWRKWFDSHSSTPQVVGQLMLPRPLDVSGSGNETFRVVLELTKCTVAVGAQEPAHDASFMAVVDV